MSRFMNEVVNTQMENLREAGKLRYAAFDEHKTERWMRVSPGADKLEPSPTFESEDHEVVNTETENLREPGKLGHATLNGPDDFNDLSNLNDSEDVVDLYKFERM